MITYVLFYYLYMYLTIDNNFSSKFLRMGVNEQINFQFSHF